MDIFRFVAVDFLAEVVEVASIAGSFVTVLIVAFVAGFFATTYIYARLMAICCEVCRPMRKILDICTNIEYDICSQVLLNEQGRHSE